MSRDEKGHTRAKQRRATSNRSSKANRSQLGAFWGAEQRQPESTTEAATDDIQGREHAGGWRATRHTQTTHGYTWKPGQCEWRSFVPNVSSLHAFGR